MEKYGRFSDDYSEYIIDNPRTPRPWVNYLTNGRYTVRISQCAGGYSFYRDKETNKILQWNHNNEVTDTPGRYLYIRDKSTGVVWSPSFQPINHEYESFQARHGLGYSIISSLTAQVYAEITYFVPLGDDCEVWLIKLINKDNKTKHLQLFPYCEMASSNYYSDETMAFNGYHKIWYDKRTHTIQARKPFAAAAHDHESIFVYTSLPVKGFATRKSVFIGRCNTEERPEALIHNSFINTPLAVGEESIAVFKHDLSIPPKKSKSFTVILGMLSQKTHLLKHFVEKYSSPSKAEKELLTVKKYWRNYTGNYMTITTPDRTLNALMNIWLKYQVLIMDKVCGYADFSESCRNAEGLAGIDPSAARERILWLAGMIREDGTVVPGWSGVTGYSSHCSSKHHTLCLTNMVAAYVKETGDRDILKEKIPFVKDKYIKGSVIDPEFKGKPYHAGEATLFDHLYLNVMFCFHDIDESGLPRIGGGDRNGAIDAAGIGNKGGSVWLAEALVRALKILARIADAIGERDKATELRKKAVLMTEKAEQFWDTEWFQRGITDAGQTFGCHKKEKRIFLDAQTEAVLAGIVTGEKFSQMLKAIEKNLNSSCGYQSVYPPFDAGDPCIGIGSITGYPVGVKENGGVVCATNADMITVHTLAGHGDKAYETLKKILPLSKDKHDSYAGEPYVAARYITGSNHPCRAGEGTGTWITSAGAKLLITIAERLLGIRRELNGFIIDPCIPREWHTFAVTYLFRGVPYHISVHNPDEVEKGVREVLVNKEKIIGNLIMPRQGEKNVVISVVLGQTAAGKKQKNRFSAVI